MRSFARLRRLRCRARYARDYNEVLRVGAIDSVERPADRADGPSVRVALRRRRLERGRQQLAEAAGTSLAENARILALLNMAMSDGLTSSMERKYHYGLAAGDGHSRR